MKELCVDWDKQGEKFVRCSALGIESPLYSILKHFTILSVIEIFRRKWQKYIDDIKVKAAPQLSQDDFVERVWKRTLADCYQLLKTCVDGSAIIADFIDAFHHLDSAEIEQNLLSLRDGLMKCFPTDPPSVPSGKKWTANICIQFEYYQRVKHYSTSAGNLLELNSYLKRTGNPKLISDLAKKVCFLNLYNNHVISNMMMVMSWSLK